MILVETALGIAEEVEALGLRGTKKKKGKHIDDDFIVSLFSFFFSRHFRYDPDAISTS